MMKAKIEKDMPFFSKMVKAMTPAQKEEIRKLLEKNRKLGK